MLDNKDEEDILDNKKDIKSRFFSIDYPNPGVCFLKLAMYPPYVKSSLNSVLQAGVVIYACMLT
jgi:hypothetical protein